MAEGAVRSGKTHAALARFAEFCLKGPAGDCAVFGKTERTVRRNVVYPLQELLPGVIRHVQGSGELYIFGRRCHVVGANDARAEEKVRGLTLAGAYLNEVSLYPKEVFDQTLARTLSIPGAKIFADTNPDSPYHWLRTEYLDLEHPKTYLKTWRFRLTDNPILPAENIEMLKALYGKGTLFYRRNIDGEWVAAEGAIYPMFQADRHIVSELPGVYDRLLVGVDYGSTNPTVFVLIGRSKGTWYVIKEWGYDSQKSGRAMTDVDYSAAMREFLRAGDGYWTPETIEVDPSAASLKIQMLRDRVGRVVDADHDVLMGISRIQSALAAEPPRLVVHESCKGLIREMANYVWDSRAQERGIDAPLKRDDHYADSLRYACMRAFGPQPLRAIRAVR